ncbi:type VI secretion system Vgr family protein [Oceanospirillum sediminis]|uniref:Type VI secretion system tip protein VgrG n=1 Tax=Oceanospirillum sediminis TaxID=2760088 RepID=A0A839IQ54_9GAMM|nr:type VI secretion system tip protein TssI/VgrG [Oceanospirillum sediminis]MBB1486619.1 type VI secretion system tip protein VgrG [Oceanospirillum sediminis]
MSSVRDSKSSCLLASCNGKEYVLMRLSYQDQLSGYCTMEADVLCENLSAADWLGETVQCELKDSAGDNAGTLRTFSGVVTGVDALGTADQDQYYRYRLQLEPWLSLLRYSRNSRVFQTRTGKDIVSEIFDELGFKGLYSIDSMPSDKREYCLQLDESDLDFVRRILSEEGVHIYAGTDNNAGKMLLHDAAKPFSKTGCVSLDDERSPSGKYHIIDSWLPGHHYHAGKLTLSGYDYSQSKMITGTKKPGQTVAGHSKLEDTRYYETGITGAFSDLKSAVLTSRLAQIESEYWHINGSTDSYELFIGGLIKLENHPDDSQKGEYLITSLSYEFTMNSQNAFEQVCRFSCVPSSHKYYPEFIEKPRVHSMLSAVVSGDGSDPASDKEGRIRIKFHWDKTTGDKTSCWVRVAQSMAGNGYGVQFIPREGQEVLVSFLNGDPDQPVVTGSLYNSKHTPPYPTAKTTQSGIKTQLSGKSNELRFDDNKDKEQLYLHAAKDMLTEVENNQETKILAERKVQVTKDSSHSTDENLTVSAKKNISSSAEENYARKAGKDISDDAGDNYSLKTGKEISLSAGSDYSLNADGDASVKASNIYLKADSKIELSVGSSKITMSSSKIEIKSTNIEINGSAKVDIKSSGAVNVKSTGNLKLSGLNAELAGSVSAKVSGGATAELSASGQAAVKGAIVMIN